MTQSLRSRGMQSNPEEGKKKGVLEEATSKDY